MSSAAQAERLLTMRATIGVQLRIKVRPMLRARWCAQLRCFTAIDKCISSWFVAMFNRVLV